jgi:Xaa-Pro aminopeptidase
MTSIFLSRIKKLQKSLKNSPFLIIDGCEVKYFTGLIIDGVWLLVSRKRSVLFCPQLLKEQVKKLTTGSQVVSDGQMVDLLTSFCKKEAFDSITVNPRKISYDLFNKINSKLNVKNDDNLIDQMRLVKDEYELKNIRKSCKITSEAVQYIRTQLKPGKTELQISFKIEEYFLKNYVRTSFLPIVASGPNSALPHHVSSLRKIRKNDTVLIDLGCIYNGYCSDLTRTFFLGKISSLQKKIYSLVENAQRQGIQNLLAGKRAFEIDALTREVFSNAGFEKYFVHSTGHGIGIEVHEPPRIAPKDETALRPGMVVTVEPGIYLPGKFGVRIEDTIEITKKGTRVLTR